MLKLGKARFSKNAVQYNQGYLDDLNQQIANHKVIGQKLKGVEIGELPQIQDRRDEQEQMNDDVWRQHSIFSLCQAIFKTNITKANDLLGNILRRPYEEQELFIEFGPSLLRHAKKYRSPPLDAIIAYFEKLLNKYYQEIGLNSYKGYGSSNATSSISSITGSSMGISGSGNEESIYDDYDESSHAPSKTGSWVTLSSSSGRDNEAFDDDDDDSGFVTTTNDEDMIMKDRIDADNDALLNGSPIVKDYTEEPDYIDDLTYEDSRDENSRVEQDDLQIQNINADNDNYLNSKSHLDEGLEEQGLEGDTFDDLLYVEKPDNNSGNQIASDNLAFFNEGQSEAPPQATQSTSKPQIIAEDEEDGEMPQSHNTTLSQRIAKLWDMTPEEMVNFADNRKIAVPEDLVDEKEKKQLIQFILQKVDEIHFEFRKVLEKLTKNQLIEYAKNHNMKIPSKIARGPKIDLINLIADIAYEEDQYIDKKTGFVSRPPRRETIFHKLTDTGDY